MSQYFDKSDLFLDPKVKQYGSHMVMSNVHKPTKTKYVNIDTKFSDEYNNFSVANYNITLPEHINDVKSLTVTNMELPMSFYNISSSLGNNSFQITNLDVDTQLPYITGLSSGSINANAKFVDTIVIPDGYYTIEELKTTINNQINKIRRIPTNSKGNIVVDANGPPKPSVPTTTSAPTPTATWPPKLLSASATSLPESFGQTAIDKVGKVDRVWDAGRSEEHEERGANGDVEETLAL